MAGETVLVIDDSPTIVRLVQLVLTKAGLRVESANDGDTGIEAARKTRPDLILLDFVMPKMNGYQFCQELHRDNDLKDIPIVLVSAKGDEVGDRFVKVMGIVDYITKPFSPDALLAVVDHTIRKYGRREQGEYTPPLIHGANELIDEPADNTREFRGEALERAREQIIQHLLTAAKDSALALDLAAFTHLASQALDPTTMSDIVLSVPSPSLHGDLRVFPIAEVLQLLDAQHQSGVLSISRAKGHVDIYFDKGRIDLAIAAEISDEYLLGRFIIETERMTRQDFEGFLESRGPGTKLIGNQLVKLGYISEDDLTSAPKRQTGELIYEILRWSFGNFIFHRATVRPPAAEQAALALGVEEILMEGFRRVDEWHLIEREIADFDLVFLRNEDAITQMGRQRLTREELTTLELVNGKHSVKDIVRRARLGSFEVSKMLYRLLSIKLIRRRVLPVAV